MSRARFVVVRSDAKKPWHVRLISNGKITLSSQQYTRMVGAERCVLSAAHIFGLSGVATLKWNVPGVEKVFAGRDGQDLGVGLPTVLYVDERGQS